MKLKIAFYVHILCMILLFSGCKLIDAFFGESTKNQFKLEPLESVEVSVDSAIIINEFQKSFNTIYQTKSNFARKYATDVVLRLKKDKLFKILYNKNTNSFTHLEDTELENPSESEPSFTKGSFNAKYKLNITNISFSNLFINDYTGKIQSAQLLNCTEYCIVKVDYTLIDDKKNEILNFTTTSQESVTLFYLIKSLAGALIVNAKMASGYISKELSKQMSEPKNQ